MGILEITFQTELEAAAWMRLQNGESRSRANEVEGGKFHPVLWARCRVEEGMMGYNSLMLKKRLVIKESDS